MLELSKWGFRAKAMGKYRELLGNRNNSVGNLNGKTGHLTKVIDNLNNNRNREYEFDAIGRLTKAKGGTNSLWTQSYSYDRYGNRTSVAATGVSDDANSTPMVPDGIPNLTFNTSSNRITTSNATGQFEYDVAGNQTRALAEDGANWLRFEYDAANRLVEVKQDNGTPVQSQQFGVGNGRLALTDHVTNQKTYYSDNAVEYTEFGGNGVLVWTKSLIYFGDSVLSTITPNGQGGEYTEYNHPDRLGTRLVTNQQAGTSYEQVNLPFGTALNTESTGSTGRRFTSYERSARTGLDYAQNRTYDSKQGRFTQVDPIGMGSVELSNPQTLNLYAYCTNDPVNYIDPSGLGFFRFLKKLFKWIMVAIAVIVAVITIIAAPATIAGVLGAISAGAGAISSVAGALGYNKVARIFGIIAVITGFGSVIAAKLGVGQSLFGFAIAREGTSKLFSPWTGIFLGVGSIFNSFSSNNDDLDDPVIFNITFTAISDAYEVFKKDPKCAKFFGLTDTKGRFSQKKLDQFLKDVKFKADVKGGPHVAQTVGKNVTFYGKFYNDGVFTVSRAHIH
jgi:RHS repeat-associated protein